MGLTKQQSDVLSFVRENGRVPLADIAAELGSTEPGDTRFKSISRTALILADKRLLFKSTEGLQTFYELPTEDTAVEVMRKTDYALTLEEQMATIYDRRRPAGHRFLYSCIWITFKDGRVGSIDPRKADPIETAPRLWLLRELEDVAVVMPTAQYSGHIGLLTCGNLLVDPLSAGWDTKARTFLQFVRPNYARYIDPVSCLVAHHRGGWMLRPEVARKIVGNEIPFRPGFLPPSEKMAGARAAVARIDNRPVVDVALRNASTPEVPSDTEILANAVMVAPEDIGKPTRREIQR